MSISHLDVLLIAAIISVALIVVGLIAGVFTNLRLKYKYRKNLYDDNPELGIIEVATAKEKAV